MKRLLTIATLFVSVLLFTACDDKDALLNTISVKSSYSCSYDRQTLTIDYRLSNNDESVIATSNADWIKIIDTSKAGKVTLDIAFNSSTDRSAVVTLRATGYAPTDVTITQIAAPKDTSHTLMFYFFGTSLGRYFKTNIEDAKAAISTGVLGNDNRVIYLMQDSKHTARICEICFDASNGECIEREIEQITIDGELITTDAIAANIAKMADSAEAESYGIVFAGHGQGWIPREVLNGSEGISTFSTMNVWQPAVGAEVTRAFGENNVQVNPAELAEGIEKSGVELDYILFDACFMANIEAIYDLRNSADYIIASPCEIMGKGFPYHRTLPYLFARSGDSSDVTGAAESYHLYYRDEYTSLRCGSVAVFDCREIEALADATSQVVKSAKNKDEYDYTKLQTYEGQVVHQFYDFGEWVNVVATDEAALKQFNEQLARTVIDKYTLTTFYSAYGSYGTYKINVDIYSGVTTSAPSEAYPDYWKKTNWYKAVWE